ncbi:MAG: peptidase U32 family protein, partial [Phoenicibacter congonensis]|nr:peptidase U32 family protein [Phoenicibacter congonensis]
PAGSPASLNAAVRGGADAVYLGLDNFNARRSADNFTTETLKDACDYCHSRGVKVYVTVNTIIITKELPELLRMVEKAHVAGADAFIVQDVGIAAAISDVFGPEKVHISTQMNIHNVAGVHAAKALGAGRITLARELSLGEIEQICDAAHELDMEIECFAHGAICVCYSGQCLMSSCIGARSANRGMCAQACRLPYSLLRGDEKANVKRAGSAPSVAKRHVHN